MILKRTLQNWGLIALLLLVFVFLLIPYGPAITFDTVSFLQAGDNFWSHGKYVHYAADGGLEFAAHRFPLYPLLLSLFNGISFGSFILQLLLFFGTLTGLRFLAKDRNVKPYPVLLLATFSVLICYYCLWTEALYGCLFVWLLYFLSKEEDYRPVWMVVMLVALLCLTRMVGVVVGGSLFLAYLIEKRNLRGLLILISTIVIIGGWTLLGSYHLGETARQISFHPVGITDVWDLFSQLGSWILPYNLPYLTLLIGVFLCLFPLFFLWLSRREADKRGLLFYFLNIHFYAYIVFLFLSKSFIDQSIPIESRTLFPLILNLIALFILFLGYKGFSEELRAKFRFLIAPMFIVIVVLNVRGLNQLKENGIGYGSKEWQSFWFVEILDELDGDVIYTNDQATLYLYSPQIEHPQLLPQKKDLYSGEINETYKAQMDVMFHELQQSDDGMIIWIRNGITADVYPSYETLKWQSDFEIVYDDWLCLVLEVKE